jgi:succinoglycan biosynthesis transport protein ExoP
MNTVADRGLSPHDLAGSADAEDETLDLVRYARAVSRNKWSILALVISLGILATLIAHSLTPIYRGTATILIESNKPKLVSIDEVYNQLAGATAQFFQTQAEILKSRDLAAKLSQRLKLAEHPAFDPRRQPPPFWQRWLPEGMFGGPPAPPSAAAIEQRVIGILQRNLTVQPVRGSQLVRLTFDSSDREMAAQIPNALTELYIESDLEARMAMTQKATTWLTSQSGDLKKKLSEAEQALQSFRERERIIEAKGLAQSGVASQLADLQKAAAEARAKRTEAEYIYTQVTSVVKGKSPETLETLPAMQKHPTILRAREQEADAEKRVNEASKRYGSEHPRLIAAESDLKSARENLRRQIAAAAQMVTREFDAAKATEASMERALAAAKGEMQNINRKEFQLASLEREVANSRQLYEMFLQRFKETNISSEMQSAIARVVDPAIVPASPFGPDKRLIIGLSLLGALILGLALAVLVERLNNTLKTTHDVEHKLGVPVLGMVQITKPKRGQLLDRVFLDDPQTSFAESIRTIRSAVLLSALDNPKKTVVVTSSVPEEGKTTVAINLAFALGQVKKTVLIDADMRRPRVGKVLGGQGNSPLVGLAQVVAGEIPLERCLYPVADTQLHVIPAGRVPPNPLELLASHRFTDLIERLQKIFDVIIIDTPPVQLVSDALVLASLASEVVYVVKADDTPYPLARVGIKRLRRMNAPLTGVVLNQLDLEKADRYYGEYSGYGKRYGKYGKKYGYGYAPAKD